MAAEINPRKIGSPFAGMALAGETGRQMENLWNDVEASLYKGVLGPRVYTSRLLGRNRSLVLHGGGNTSLKAKPASADVLFVKGSGSDLACVESSDFVPLDLAATRTLFEQAKADDSTLTSAVGRCVIG